MQMLALPSEFRYRLRYDVQWVDEQLRKNIESLQAKRALVIFYDDIENRFFPIRWAAIKTARKVGPIFYFELVLGDLCKYESESEACQAQVEGFNKTFLGFHYPQLVEKDGKRVLELCVLMSNIGQHVGTATLVLFGSVG